MSVLERLLAGNFNAMSQVPQPDGSILVTLTKRSDPHIYKLWVKDLYTPKQVVLKEEVLNAQERQ